MTNSTKKSFGIGGVALALVLAAGLTVTSIGDVSACDAHKGAKAEVTTASTSTAGSSCATTTKTAANTAKSEGSCGPTAKVAAASPAKAGAACGTQVKTVTASSGSACCPSAKGVQTKTAEVTFPEGIEVQRVAVDGGVNYVFTGKQLAGVESYLAAHMSACGTEAKKACGRTCSVTRDEASVVLAVRGENPEDCCVGMMTASFEGMQVDDAACGVKGAAAPKGEKATKTKTISKKS